MPFDKATIYLLNRKTISPASQR